MKNVIPILRIFDEKKAKEFYLDYLGFKVDWEHRFQPDFPLYLQLSIESVQIHLSEHHGDCSPGAAIRLECTDLQNYHSILNSKVYSFANPGIEKMPWNLNELTVHDPFSNRIIFYQNT
ncbi:glyoxalase superfamily protein [Metabacillus idriensis]|uniref:glyoxalase superfamily protein n=1 Tax=Metabacillus idriensis TaxID=324768 RepID=UPI00174C46D2|nr:glyoxalase superfamily protein [Metabacillus idriensis]